MEKEAKIAAALDGFMMLVRMCCSLCDFENCVEETDEVINGKLNKSDCELI